MPEPTGRWRALLILSIAELLAMALWFSASAVGPEIALEHSLTRGQSAWLTMSVQLGFVLGALASALTNLADRVRLDRLFALCALVGALLNGVIALTAAPVALIVVLRLLTGAALAGVYPTGMKLMATWFQRGRGLAIGTLVGALAMGSALPHLFGAVVLDGEGGGGPGWRSVMLVASGSALAAALIAWALIRAGPLLPGSARFDWRQAGRIFTSAPERRANLGYLGHMWELYAMWTWAPVMIQSSFGEAGLSERVARLIGFAIVAVGGLTCILAGATADRIGRTTTTIACLLASGSCALIAGFLFDAPIAMAVVCVIWGAAVIPDSAQFSAAISELSDARYVGTALTMQTCTGFLLTLVSIHLVPLVQESTGWGWAMAMLTLGPAVGIGGMLRLRGMREALKMASGHR